MQNSSAATDQVKGFIQKHSSIQQPDGSLLTEILNAGQKAGFKAAELWREIVDLSSKTQIQQSWSQWKTQNEREEIRLRLKALSETEQLDKSLVKFILFFFRSSDPVLYQLAAIIMGRELDNFEEFKNYFITFCKKRNTEYTSPVQLNNQRSRRRIMLVMASYLASGNKGLSMALPVSGREQDQLFQMSDSNISVTLLSCSILLKGGFTEIEDYSVQLLEHRFTTDKIIFDRNLVKNAIGLLNSLQTSEKKKSDHLKRLLQLVHHQYQAGETIAEKLKALFLFDEIIEGAVQAGFSKPKPLFQHVEGKRLKAFLVARYNFWSGDSLALPPESSTLQTVILEAAEATETQDLERQYQVYAESIGMLTNNQSWRSMPGEERVFRAFYLIEQTLHPTFVEREEHLLLFQSSGLLDLKPAHRQDEVLKVDAGQLLASLIKQLMTLEPSFYKKLFDTQLIHRLDEPEILPLLLPSNTDSEYLPIIADAVEHQIRFRLSVDPKFDPNIYLYRISIRRPHPQFYRYLLEIIQDREYTDPQGNILPFKKIIEHILAGISKPDLPPSTSEKIEYELLFWGELESFRERLLEVISLDDPIDLLHEFSTLFKGSGIEQVKRAMTLHGLLEIVQPANAHWYQAGIDPLTWENGEAILRKMESISARIDQKSERVQPQLFDDVANFTETMQVLLNQLAIARETYIPLLGYTEAKIFEGLLLQLEQKLTGWSNAYLHSCDLWMKREEAGAEQTRTAITEQIAFEEDAAIQKKLVQIFWNSELKNCADDSDDWLSGYQLLEWAAAQNNDIFSAAEVKERWHDLMEEQWIDLLEEASEKNKEARVIQLIKAKAYSSIRSGSRAKEKIKDHKSWFLSRYDGYHAYYCNRFLNPGRSIKNIFLTAKEYMSHYASVWVALLFGVIMMFDFGDPWTELAEIGDLPGVLFAFLFGVIGTFLYIYSDLNKKTVHVKTDPFSWISIVGRVTVFLSAAFIFTGLAVVLFWFMFSATDQVVHGPYALLHMLSWTGFALFIGVFLGLIGRN